MQSKNKLIDILVFGILALILVSYGFTYYASGCNSARANVFGYKLVYVGSGSMEPTIHTGSVVLCKMLDADDQIENGDICNYIYDHEGIKKTIIHRIIGMEDNLYIFKGDFNPQKDIYPVSQGQICSKYLCTIYNGK